MAGVSFVLIVVDDHSGTSPTGQRTAVVRETDVIETGAAETAGAPSESAWVP